MSQTPPENGSANGRTTPTPSTAALPNGHSRQLPTTVLPSPVARPDKSVWQRNDSHLVALYAFLTGIVLSASVALAIAHPNTPQCWLYVTALCFFHFMEYYVTAKYKSFEVTLDGTPLLCDTRLMEAFLFNNGWNYAAAQTLGFVEFLLEWYFLPHTKVISITTYAGTPPPPKKPPFFVRFLI
jgi:hypothetical protein